MEYPISIILHFDYLGSYKYSEVTEEYYSIQDSSINYGFSDIFVDANGNIIQGSYREKNSNIVENLQVLDSQYESEVTDSGEFHVNRQYTIIGESSSEHPPISQEWGMLKYVFTAKSQNLSTQSREAYFVIRRSKGGQNIYLFIVKCIQEGRKDTQHYDYYIKFSQESEYEQIHRNYVCAVSGDTEQYTFNTVYLYKQDISSQAVDLNLNISISDSNGFVTYNDSQENKVHTISFTYIPNSTDYTRSLTVDISDSDTGELLTRIQYIQSKSGSDEPPVVDEDDYWSDGDVYSCVDDNTGEIIDPTSLLFKGNSNNIYSTIEQKDNTLFLGNYTPVTNIYRIQDIVNAILGNIELQGEENSYTPAINFFTTDSNTYSYVPNMNISSQDKRIFKKGETYMMGLVFVTNTGQRSGVYYIGTFSPSSEPYTTSQGLCTKPVWNVEIPSSAVSALYNKGIVGVMPVYAEQNHYNIIAQGFISPTLTGTLRESQESIAAQYSWYQRFVLSNTQYVEQESLSHNSLAEIQTGIANERWKFNTLFYSFNSPEVEVSDLLKDSDLSDCVAKLIKKVDVESYINNVQVAVNGKYLHSRLRPMQWTDSMRISAIDLWYGFQNPGTKEETSSDFVALTNDTQYYNNFYVYPWQRSKIGAEGPDSTITSKKFFDTIFLQDSLESLHQSLPQIVDACIYKDYNTNSIVKVGGSLYQGNIDYIVTSNNAYKVQGSSTISSRNYPIAYGNTGTFYAGYNTVGDCYDPILMKYKVAPHIVLKFDDVYQDTVSQDKVHVVQLEHQNSVIDTGDRAKEYASWIKCGNQVRLFPGSTATVRFEEGDYFYGRFDSLRTYPYTQEDPNSVTEILSGMLCSRINLDARTDRNRGITSAVVTPSNFNQFNTVYDQKNNYFTYQFIDNDDVSTNRDYVNTIQWSMTKTFGSRIDDWCNIQESSSLDLDGDKGELVALKRVGNALLAFQKTGIAHILYNESVQVSSNDGLPIELANSGKVNGKRYLYDSIGCQNKDAICTTPSGVYFIDNINKTIYLIGNEGGLADICASGSMKSWALNNFNIEDTENQYICWYDKYSQEVIINSELNSLAYDDVAKKFQCFLNYFDIRHQASLGSRTYMFRNSYINSQPIVEVWKKNAIDASIFFGERAPIGLQIIANPEPSVDKTFTNVEYRADAFNGTTYLPYKTFDTIRVQTEYQDTGEVPLSNALHCSSNLKKKFRIWRIDIPRAQGSRDRIRNMWCKISLLCYNTEPTYISQAVNKFILHDLAVTYLV